MASIKATHETIRAIRAIKNYNPSTDLMPDGVTTSLVFDDDVFPSEQVLIDEYNQDFCITRILVTKTSDKEPEEEHEDTGEQPEIDKTSYITRFSVGISNPSNKNGLSYYFINDTPYTVGNETLTIDDTSAYIENYRVIQNIYAIFRTDTYHFIGFAFSESESEIRKTYPVEIFNTVHLATLQFSTQLINNVQRIIEIKHIQVYKNGPLKLYYNDYVGFLYKCTIESDTFPLYKVNYQSTVNPADGGEGYLIIPNLNPTMSLPIGTVLYAPMSLIFGLVSDQDFR